MSSRFGKVARVTGMVKVIVGGALTLGLGVGAGAGIASADAVQVEGNYATLAACQADGPNLRLTQSGGPYAHWSCHQGQDGLYYLYLST